MRPLNKSEGRVLWKGVLTDKAIFFWIPQKGLLWQPWMNLTHCLHIKSLCKGSLESWAFACFLLGNPENYTKVLQIRIAQAMDGISVSIRSKTAWRYYYLCMRKAMYYSWKKFSNGCRHWKIWCMQGARKVWQFSVRSRDRSLCLFANEALCLDFLTY